MIRSGGGYVNGDACRLIPELDGEATFPARDHYKICEESESLATDGCPPTNNENETTFTVITTQVLVQPWGSSDATALSLSVTGAALINVSTWTSIFGKAYEASLYPRPASYAAGYTAGNIIFGVVNLSLLGCHLFLIFYTDKLKNQILSSYKD